MGSIASLSRRHLLKASAAALLAGGFPSARAESAKPGIRAGGAVHHGGDLSWLPAWRLREMVAAKALSPVELVDHCLARIEAHNPALRAFTTVMAEDARAAARAAEAAVMQGRPLGPLHGIPVSFKDHIQVRGTPQAGAPAGRDDVVVDRLRRAGAIVIGKTAMQNAVFNNSANPWNLERVAGTSSTGAGASVAAGMTPIAIGSDGGGSTRLPAAYCGLFGHHPTIGRVPRGPGTGPVDFMATGWSGTLGPITRDIRDVVMAMQAIAGPDWRDLEGYKGPAPDYGKDLDAGVRGLRIAWSADCGFASEYFDPVSADVVSAVQKAAMQFASLGAIVEDPKFTVEDYHPVFRSILTALDRAVGRTPPDLGPVLDYHEALERRQRMAGKYFALFDRYDVLLTPTSPIVAPTHGHFDAWLKDDLGRFAAAYTCLTGQYNTLGFPALAVPCGFVDGMPVSLQIIARPDEDAKIFRVAQAFASAFPQSRRPNLP